MCPPVSPCKGESVVKFPAHHACIFLYGNAATWTFGRARRHRPYGFVWADYMRRRLMSFGGLHVERLMSFGKIVRKWLFCLCGIAWKNITEMGRGRLRVGGFVCWLVKAVHMNQHHRCCTFDSPGLIERSEIYPG